MDPSKMSAIQAAVDELQTLVGGADTREMMARRAPKPDMGGEAMAEECKAGMCNHPEHMSDDDMAALEG